MTSRQPSGNAASARSVASTSSFRRNLLSGSHSQQPQRRRQDTAQSSSSADTVHLSYDQTPQEKQDSAAARSRHEAQNDIIIRDEHGQFEVDQPMPLPILDEDGEDLEDDDAQDKRDTRLIDLWRSHSRQQIDEGGKLIFSTMSETEAKTLLADLHSAVQASLQKKVASLDDDRWMFEPEEETEGLQPQ
ncbi:hypothetical protein FH972_023655 [Carpinus fangiana]|uniref:Uncharacterized protein n=1 Tax=Carpinus fangiana TaxID=176857 RepID=A0A5N6KW72_9ROSI|nr:hypothetical protein FH972_023655 [Carpinus fangiana]